MPWKGIGREYQDKARLSVWNIGDHTFDDGVGSGNKRFLYEAHPVIIKDSEALVLVGVNCVYRVHRFARCLTLFILISIISEWSAQGASGTRRETLRHELAGNEFR